VYTVAPSTIYKLYKQRLRWIYGFIQNTIDYRHLLFKKKYGTFSLFTVPSGVVSVIAVPFMLFWLFYKFVKFVIEEVVKISATGWSWPTFSTGIPHSITSFDWFYINTNTTIIVAVIVYFLVITSMVLGKRIAYGKGFFGFGMIFMMLVYSLISPFWIMKALFNSISRSTPKWR
jgi:cellulose synthase/poly-beta-1,6-N-acetylglucosamine synthase-like glycosyltransferase